MHPMKNGFILILLSLFLLLTGCGSLPSPSSLIRSPQYENANEQRLNRVDALVKENLPEGTTLYIPENPSGSEAVHLVDMDYDGMDEIFITYKYTDKNMGVGCILLKRQTDGWVKLFDEVFHIDRMNWAVMDDFSGDRNLELLIGVGLDDYYSCRIYAFDSKMTVIYKGEYSFLDIISLPDQGQKCLALLTKRDQDYLGRQTINGYYGKIIKWDGTGFALAEEAYKDNFSILEPYYRKEIEKSKTSVIAAYYYAEWMVNCNRPQEALNLIENIKKNNSILYTDYIINTSILEAQVFSELAMYDEAEEKMSLLINEIENGHYGFIQRRLPYLYLLRGRNCKYSGDLEKAKEMFELSLENNDEFSLRNYEENKFWKLIAFDEYVNVQEILFYQSNN